MTFDKQTYNREHYLRRKARAQALQDAWAVFVRNAEKLVSVLPDKDRGVLERAYEVLQQ